MNSDEEDMNYLGRFKERRADAESFLTKKG